MARIRSVKPQLRKDDHVATWKREVRYFWVLLWGYLDDFGRGEDNERLIVADCFPLDDDLTAAKIGKWLDIFAARKPDDSDFVPPLCRYEVNGRRYLHSVKWDRHQRPNRPTPSVIPPCPIHERLTEPLTESLSEPLTDKCTEGSLRARKEKGRRGDGEGDFEVPPSAGELVIAEPADPEVHLGQVVAAYVDGATEAGLPRPSERLRGKVGRDARRLAEKERVPVAALVAAARSMGSRGWDDLDREIQRVSANARPQNGIPNMVRPSTTDQRVSAGLALAAKYEAMDEAMDGGS